MFNLTILICLCVISTHYITPVDSFDHIIKYFEANDTVVMHEDIEPVLEQVMKRLQKELFQIGQEIIFDEEIPQECLNGFAKVMKAAQAFDLWALKLLDASGGLLHGAMDGKIASFGNYDGCLAVRAPDTEDPTKSLFGGRYCTISLTMKGQPFAYRTFQNILDQDPLLQLYMGQNATEFMISVMEKFPLGARMSFCLPSVCQGDIIEHFVEKFGGKYGLHADVMACKSDFDLSNQVTNTQIFIIIFLVLTVILVVIMTFIHHSTKRDGFAHQLAACFSITESYRKLVNTDIVFENIHLNCIHGIRVLSCIWILLGHTYGGDAALFDRPYQFIITLQSPSFTMVSQSVLAVDTFFVLTGILLYRTILSEISGKKSPPTIIVAMGLVIRRCFRLIVPTLGCLAFFYIIPLISSGPGIDFIMPYSLERCDSSWWTLPLFVSNFIYAIDNTCLPHLWYNSVDVQLLIMLVVPTIIFVRTPKKGAFIISTFIFFSMIYTLFVSYIYNAAPTMILHPRQILADAYFGSKIHDKPMPHVASMAVGILGGFIIEHRRHIKLPRNVIRFGWVLSTAISLLIVFGPYPWQTGRVEVNQTIALIYGFLWRPLWALIICWVCYACAAGRGGFVHWFLRRPCFIVFSRLSFCFYIMQLPILIFKNGMARNHSEFTYYHQMRQWIADCVLNYLLAFMLYTFFEAPAYGIDKLTASCLKAAKPVVEKANEGCPKNQTNDKTSAGAINSKL